MEIAADRNSLQKHVWRTQIVLLSADGVGTNEIMRVTNTSKTCVRRWQQRFMEAGTDGLLIDKTRAGWLCQGSFLADGGDAGGGALSPTFSLQT